MSFEQPPAEDGPGRDPQGPDTTGRIYAAEDHTQHLPAHPRQDDGSAAGGAQSDPFAAPQSGSRPQPTPPYAGRPQYGESAPAGQQYAPMNQGAPTAQGGYAPPSYAGQPPIGGGPYGGGPGGPAGAPTHQPRPRNGKRWAAVPIAAVLAAALASGGTYALTKDNNSSNASGGSNTTVVQANPADFGNGGVNWAATASKVAPSVVSITVIAGSSGDQGSGVILDTNGNIVTNNHVVSGAGANAKVTVTLNDNRTYAAKVVGTDVSTDLAVIKLDNPPKDLKPMAFGDDKKLVVGQPVMAVGNPLGLAGTMTTGIVSALNRPVTTHQESQNQSQDPFAQGQEQCTDKNCATTNAIQTSAAINPGNSGGALVTGSGKLIGINSSIATLGQTSGSSQSGNIGIGFAIPVTVVQNITSQLMKTGKAKHPQIGVRVFGQTATVKLGDASVQGAKIDSVGGGSPAAKAGLKAGDVVIKFDGQQIVYPASDSLIGFVRAHKVGDKVTLTIVRDGKQQNVTVTLGEASSG